MNKGKSYIEYENSNSFRFIPVKEQIIKLDETISKIREDYNENVKTASMIRNHFKELDDISRIKLSEMTHNLINEIKNFQEDIYKIKDSDKNELYFIKQEVQGLINDKKNISRSLIIINTRLSQVEIDIGVGYNLYFLFIKVKDSIIIDLL
jgi:hypothetical protein